MRKQYINYPSNLPVNISYYNIHNYPTHWHNSTEIIYVLEGSINISIDTDSFTLKENEVEIINPDECHSFSSENDNKVLIFQIDPDFFEKYYKAISIQERIGKSKEYFMLEELAIKYRSKHSICEFVNERATDLSDINYILKMDYNSFIIFENEYKTAAPIADLNEKGGYYL